MVFVTDSCHMFISSFNPENNDLSTLVNKLFFLDNHLQPSNKIYY